MIFQFDSCRKGKIHVICISGKLLMWGNATTLIIWFTRGIPIPVGWGVGKVTEGTTEQEDAEQKVKDAVPLIMAKQQLLNGLDINEEMKELVKIMGKIDVLRRMIVSLFAVYVALVMYSVATT